MSGTERELTVYEFMAASRTQESIMAADVDEDTKRKLERDDHAIGCCRMHWNLCVHESGHAVEAVRTGVSFKKVVVFEPDTRTFDQSNGEIHWRRDDLPTPDERIRISVAGHAAERLWGVNKVYNINALLRRLGNCDADMLPYAQTGWRRTGVRS